MLSSSICTCKSNNEKVLSSALLRAGYCETIVASGRWDVAPELRIYSIHWQPILAGLSQTSCAGPEVIIGNMPTSRDIRPLTSEQEVQLRRDLTLVEERLQDIAILMRISYGEESQAVIRADETSAALQRLKWELERTKVRKLAAGS